MTRYDAPFSRGDRRYPVPQTLMSAVEHVQKRLMVLEPEQVGGARYSTARILERQLDKMCFITEHRIAEREVGPIDGCWEPRRGMNERQRAASTSGQASERGHILSVLEQLAGALDRGVKIVVREIRG